MKIVHTPDEKLLEVEATIHKAVADRIHNDTNVVDCYMRINPDTVQITVMYIEESLAAGGKNDIALLDLMEEIYDEANDCTRLIPDAGAIHQLAQSFREMIEITLCDN